MTLDEVREATKHANELIGKICSWSMLRKLIKNE